MLLVHKALSYISKKWRGEGKMVSMFLDDGFGCNKSYDTTVMIATQIKQDLLNSGFIPNDTTSVWVPVQELDI